jgi:hypothetical protein
VSPVLGPLLVVAVIGVVWFLVWGALRLRAVGRRRLGLPPDEEPDGPEIDPFGAYGIAPRREPEDFDLRR